MEQLKNSELQQWKELHKDAILLAVSSFFEEKIEAVHALKNQFIQLLNANTTYNEKVNQEKSEIIKEGTVYNQQLLDLIEEIRLVATKTDQENLIDPVKNIFSGNPVEAYIQREEVRAWIPLKPLGDPRLFVRILNDNTKLLLLKSGYHVGVAFRKMTQKAVKPIHPVRQRQIPFGEMLQQALFEGFLKEVEALTPGFLEKLAHIIQNMWTFDNQFDEFIIGLLLTDEKDVSSRKALEIKGKELDDELNAAIQEMKQQLSDQSEALFEQSLGNLDEAMLAIGTPFQPKLVSNQFVTADKNNFKVQKQWQNTIHSMIDDWMTDIRFGVLFYNVYKAFSDEKIRYDEEFHVPLTQQFDEAILLLNKLREGVENESQTVDAIISQLQKKQVKIEQNLKNDVLQKAQVLLKKWDQYNFNSLIEACKASKETLEKKQRFYANRNKLQPIRDAAVQWIVPLDLLSYTAIPGLEKAIENFRITAQKQVEQTSQLLDKSIEVALFNLDTAIMMLSESKINGQQAFQMVKEGFSRTISYLDEAAEGIQKLEVKGLHTLEEAIHAFKKNISKLMDSTNLSELNLQIARARALDRSKHLKEHTTKDVKQKFKTVYAQTKSFIKKTTAYVFRMQVQLGMQTEKKAVGYLLSAFISNTSQKLSRLPLVYQRLFQFSNKHEDRFFVGRTNEINTLNKALAVWQEGGFVITALIGEKGSGKSALIQHFYEKHTNELQLLKIELNEKIIDEKALCKWLSLKLLKQQCEDFERLVELVNAIPQKSVIVLKNMQHLFLKTVDGFEAQHRLLDLLYQTARNHFWIVTYTPISFNFLDQTHRIADNYTHLIRLENPDYQMLEKLILFRHGFSGFQLSFEKGANPSRFFGMYHPSRLIKAEESQTIFFRELQNQTNGNISLALMYWIHHIEMLDEKTILVHPISIPEVDYIRELSSEIHFSLHLLLLHDGLNEEDFIKLSGQSPLLAKAALISLKEKGLLIQRSNKYTINPVVYPFVTNILKSHNLIY